MNSKVYTQRAAGLKHGFRSGLEEQVAEQLEKAGVPVVYEKKVLRYNTPCVPHKYTPDFELPNGIIVETKGRFLLADRKKHLLVQQQHPELDIRFVFSNSKARISKSSHTSYALWCERNSFKYADKLIPVGWLKEKKNGIKI